MHLKVRGDFRSGSDFPYRVKERAILFNELKEEKFVLVVNFGLQIIIKYLVFHIIQKHDRYKNVSAENVTDFRKNSLM